MQKHILHRSGSVTGNVKLAVLGRKGFVTGNCLKHHWKGRDIPADPPGSCCLPQQEGRALGAIVGMGDLRPLPVPDPWTGMLLWPLQSCRGKIQHSQPKRRERVLSSFRIRCRRGSSVRPCVRPLLLPWALTPMMRGGPAELGAPIGRGEWCLTPWLEACRASESLRARHTTSKQSSATVPGSKQDGSPWSLGGHIHEDREVPASCWGSLQV